MRHLVTNRAVWGALALLGLSAALMLPMGRAKEISRPEREVRRVTTDLATLGAGTSRFRAQGVTRARQRAGLGFTLPGRLLARPVRVGDRVSAGQLLARLDARGYDHGARAAEATARQATAQLTMHENDRARLDVLGSARAVSADQLDRIGSAVDAARATRDAAEVQLREAERTLRETELRAPFAATVVAVNLEPGEFAAPGQPVVVLSGEDGLEIEVDVPGRVASHLQTNDAARVRFPLEVGVEGTARITSVSESAAGTRRLFPIVVATEADGVQPGTAAEVVFEFAAAPQLTVPASAIVAPAGVDASVFRVRNGRAERVAVSLGHLSGTRVAVVGKLNPGDHLVTAGYTGLIDGETVIEVAP
jgi:RND family efflux transporter MFP subunit